MWISEVDERSYEDLENSKGFETLDAKIASGLGEILQGEFQRKINVDTSVVCVTLLQELGKDPRHRKGAKAC